MTDAVMSALIAKLATNDPTNPAHRLAMDLQRGEIRDAAVAADVAHVLTSLQEMQTPAARVGMTVTLVETAPHLPAAGSMAIRKWDNHGLPAGTHTLYARPAELREAVKDVLSAYGCNNAEPVELRDALVHPINRLAQALTAGGA